MCFNDEFKADEVLLTLSRLQREHLLELADAAVVVRDTDGTVKIRQTHNLVSWGALTGGFWGPFLGLLFGGPLGALVVGGGGGAAVGAITGKLTATGIRDHLIKELSNELQPGTPALFVLVIRATADRVLDALKQFEGRILHSSLSKDDEAELEQALGPSS